MGTHAKTFSFAPAFSERFFQELGWSPRARNLAVALDATLRSAGAEQYALGLAWEGA